MNNAARPTRDAISRALHADGTGTEPAPGVAARLAAVAGGTAPMATRVGGRFRRGVLASGAVGVLLTAGMGASYATGLVEPSWLPPVHEQAPATPDSPPARTTGISPTLVSDAVPPASVPASGAGRPSDLPTTPGKGPKARHDRTPGTPDEHANPNATDKASRTPDEHANGNATNGPGPKVPVPPNPKSRNASRHR